MIDMNYIISLVFDNKNYCTNVIPIITLIICCFCGIIFTKRSENKETNKKSKEKISNGIIIATIAILFVIAVQLSIVSNIRAENILGDINKLDIDKLIYQSIILLIVLMLNVGLLLWVYLRTKGTHPKTYEFNIILAMMQCGISMIISNLDFVRTETVLASTLAYIFIPGFIFFELQKNKTENTKNTENTENTEKISR
ncbi:hypothetical protein [Lonepinella sp. BR2919]|uniref:hypothetical protein n=1 Tax=unclassified Lonepinella TaxID=2642006 RepID=UPI003F6DF25F